MQLSFEWDRFDLFSFKVYKKTTGQQEIYYMVEDTIKLLAKTAIDLKKAANLLQECNKLKANMDKNAFLLEPQLCKLAAGITALKDAQVLIGKIEEWKEEALNEAHAIQARFKNIIASDLDERLKPSGLIVKGHFPELKCGIFTLEFLFGKLGAVKIYYGPKITLLKKTLLAAESVAEAVIELFNEFNEPLDEPVFIKNLEVAYNKACMQEGKKTGEGSAVPICMVMQEMTFLRQKRDFLINPIKENFSSYGRVKFSYDLARLKNRTYKDKKLALVVAAMAQTKQQESSLWVPNLPGGDGSHYTSLSFV
ncbi:MAG: hypothetical protein V1753_09735 [Pseudomonadota bacterium]